MAAKAHAILSASSSDRWLHCPPSARLCETYEDKGSDYAAEGTDAHALGEYKLKTTLGMPADDPTDSLKWYSEEMEDCTSGYAEYVLEQRPDLIAPDDLVLVPDFGTADGTLIEVAEKGTLWLKVTVTGVQCHASTPDEGKNALVAASAMILRVREVEERFNAVDPLFTPPRSTMAATRHDANVPNVNTIPGKDVFFIDCRVLPAYSVDEVLDAFRGLGAEIAAQYGVTVAVDVVSREPAAPATPVNSEVVTLLKEAIFRIYGLECHAGGIGGGTVARLVRHRNIPAAVWSRVFDNAHVPNEAARLSDAVNDARVYSCLLFAR